MVKLLQKYSIQHKLRFIIKIFLIAIIPILTLGFSVFEKTPLYSWLIKVQGIESSINKRLITQYGDPHRLIIDRQHNIKEFDNLWKLVLKYSEAELSKNSPKLISRVAVENSSYVIIPQKGKVILIPDSAPVLALYCTEQQVRNGECKGANSVMIGTVGDIKKWLEKKRQGIRSIVDLLISIVSVLLGVMLELRQPSIEAKET